MALLIDQASAARSLTPDEFRAWAAGRVVFISSEMRELADIRRVLADGLREAGFQVVMFEDLGGRDDDAQTAYLTGVANSHIYLGLVGDRYGAMLETGYSPTHEEYRTAREHGLRMSVWIHADDRDRQGNARDFVQEIQTFNTTGSFRDGAGLLDSVLTRLAEMAADDEQPWIKIGDAVFRCARLRDDGQTLQVEATVRDEGVVRYLSGLTDAGFGRGLEVSVATHAKAGRARVTGLVAESSSRSAQNLTLAADVSWGASGGGMDASFGNYSPDDQVEMGLRTGLFAEPPPDGFDRMLTGMLSTEDPLGPLDGLPLGQGTFEAVAHLLLVERLVGEHGASAVIRTDIGPLINGARNLHLEWIARQRYTNEEPQTHIIQGRRG